MILPPKEVVEEQDTKVRELMRAGLAEYRKKNLEGAREAFARAWETARRPDVAAALADVEMKLGRYRDAAEHWDYYLQTNPSDQAEAAARLDECRAHVAAIRVELDPPGAELEVDGVRVPTRRRGGTIWLEPGAHALVARDQGRSSWPQTVDVSATQMLDVRLVVAPPAVAPLGTTTPSNAPPLPQPLLVPEKSDERGGIQTRTVVLIGGVTLTAAGAALGVWSLIRRSDADHARQQALDELHEQFPEKAETNNVCYGQDRPTRCADVSANSDEAVHAGNWAIGSFIGAGVIGTATITAALLWPGTEKKPKATSFVITPMAGRSFRGVDFQMQF